MVDRFFGAASIGVGDSSDLYLQQDHNQITSIGAKRTFIDVPGSHSFAMTAGGFATKSYLYQNNDGRDTGGFIGAITNWYAGNGFFALQLRHSFVDHHEPFSGQGAIFHSSNRYEQVTQMGLSYRGWFSDTNNSFKTGFECYLGSKRLPERSDFPVDDDVEICSVILGFSHYFIRQ